MRRTRMRTLALKAMSVPLICAGSLIAAASGNKMAAADRTSILNILSAPAKVDKFEHSIPIAWEPELLSISSQTDSICFTDSGAVLKVAYQKKPIKLKHFDFSLLKRFARGKHWF